MQHKIWRPLGLLSSALSAVFLLLVPVCFIVVYSFWLRAPTGADIPAFQFGNYAKFFADFFYPAVLIRTIRVSLETVVICLIMGYIPAYFFYRSKTSYFVELENGTNIHVINLVVSKPLKRDEEVTIQADPLHCRLLPGK